MEHIKLNYKKEQVREEILTFSTLIHNLFQLETTLTKLSLEPKRSSKPLNDRYPLPDRLPETLLYFCTMLAVVALCSMGFRSLLNHPHPSLLPLGEFIGLRTQIGSKTDSCLHQTAFPAVRSRSILVLTIRSRNISSRSTKNIMSCEKHLRNLL